MNRKLKMTTEEFISKAKELYGDKYDYSKSLYVNGATKCEIICKDHGSFWQTSNSHSQGEGCMKCSGKEKLTTEEFIKRSISMHGDLYDYSESKYIRNKDKIGIKCKKHGMFYQRADIHLAGGGCLKCTGKNKTTEDFVKDAQKIHNYLYDYSKTIYNNSSEKIIITCKNHGEFYQTATGHLNGNGCPKCVGRDKTTDDFIKDASKIHNNKYDYSKTVYKDSKLKIIIKCPLHGEFLKTPNSHLSGQGCRICSGKEKLNTDLFIKKAISRHGNVYDYSKVNYITSNAKVEIVCRKHGSFWQRGGSHLYGDGCSFCSGKISKSEIEFLNYMNINERGTRLPEWKKKPVDGYDPETKTVYEFLGDYWHGNPETNIDMSVVNNDKKKTMRELYIKTFEGFKKLKSFGYNVKYIWENDWNKFKKKQVDILKIQEY